MPPTRSSSRRSGGPLVYLGGALMLLSGVVLAGYLVSVRSAAAESATPAAAPAAPVDHAKGAHLAGTSVELELDGRKVTRSWDELGLVVGKDPSGEPTVAIDRAKAEPALVALRRELDRGPINARLDLEKRKVFPEQAGYGIDLFGSLSALEAAARDGEARVVLEGAVLPAPVTVASLGIADVSVELAHFETTFPVGEKARNDNLKLVASHIDGAVLQPGQEFSFNKIVGDRTLNEGYKVAHVITAGEMVDGIAGGACQISTTLHGAAFFAGLEIVDTTPHSRPSVYVPLGLDATVVYPGTDLVLKNAFDFPVAIHYTVARGVARVEILGKAKPYDRAEFVRTVKEETPFETITREDDTIGMGYMVVDQPGFPGYKIIRERNLYRGKKVVKHDKWTLNYKPVIEYVRMGTSPDPNLPKPEEKKLHTPKPGKKGSVFHLFG